MRTVRTLLFLTLSLTALPAGAAVEGLVVTEAGTPVEGARVELLEAGDTRVTDARGAFRFPGAQAPVTVLVTHPRFELLSASCCGDAPLTLTPKQPIYGEIDVTAGGTQDTVKPVSVATTATGADDRPAAVTSVVDLAEGLAGVAQSGQGGLFQAYSIRGTGGQRVRTTVAGVRIVTERRAGATASFIDPLLLGSVSALRGPYAPLYGSGALGGVLDAAPKRFDGLSVDLGWESEGDEAYQVVGWGADGWSVGLARRASDPTETPDGQFLPSQYEQLSATVAKSWSLTDGLEVDLLLAPSLGDDIGKPNRRYPTRITTYTDERHLVGSFTVRRPGEWKLTASLHPNSLDTENRRSDSMSVVESRATDFGLELVRELSLPRSVDARLGVDYFGRRGVEATERVQDFAAGTSETVTSLDGREDEVGLFADLRRRFGPVSVELGGRLTWVEQANAGSSTTDDTAATGFLGLTMPVGKGFEVVANLGTGFRFPGLSERYFSGATGRGEIIANEDLDPERSLNTDVGLRFFGDRLFLAGYLFRLEVDDYIERVEVEEDVQTLVNLTAGTIRGFELEGFFQVVEPLRLEWSGQFTDGDGDDGQPLAASPADRVTLGAHLERGPWSGALRWQHRFDKDDPGPGEVATDAADVVSASMGYAVSEELALRLFADNLLDETYLPSADDLAVPAPQRSVGVGVSWRR